MLDSDNYANRVRGKKSVCDAFVLVSGEHTYRCTKRNRQKIVFAVGGNGNRLLPASDGHQAQTEKENI